MKTNYVVLFVLNRHFIFLQFLNYLRTTVKSSPELYDVIIWALENTYPHVADVIKDTLITDDDIYVCQYEDNSRQPTGTEGWFYVSNA